jgi:hypothetical protein
MVSVGKVISNDYVHYVMGAVCLCKARVALHCSFCKRRLEVTRPDSSHPLCLLEKPSDDEAEGDVVTQVCTCKNSDCNKEIPVYWYEAKMFLDRE